MHTIDESFFTEPESSAPEIPPDLVARLALLLTRLTVNERIIVRNRFGLDTGLAYTAAELAELLPTPEEAEQPPEQKLRKIQRLEQSALQKLCCPQGRAYLSGRRAELPTREELVMTN